MFLVLFNNTGVHQKGTVWESVNATGSRKSRQQVLQKLWLIVWIMSVLVSFTERNFWKLDFIEYTGTEIYDDTSFSTKVDILRSPRPLSVFGNLASMVCGLPTISNTIY